MKSRLSRWLILSFLTTICSNNRKKLGTNYQSVNLDTCTPEGLH